MQSSKKGSSVHTQSNHPVAVAANKSTTFQGAEWFHKNVNPDLPNMIKK